MSRAGEINRSSFPGVYLLVGTCTCLFSVGKVVGAGAGLTGNLCVLACIERKVVNGYNSPVHYCDS